jgi:hypothetical protein
LSNPLLYEAVLNKFKVLAYLRCIDSAPAQSISDRLGINKTIGYRILRELEVGGYIQTVTNKNAYNMKCYKATDKGYKLGGPISILLELEGISYRKPTGLIIGLTDNLPVPERGS